ncbi:xanthine dehydrogenase family protein molybdopterin-binding subunit, partial [Polaribacter sp.]|nr:xanthine dehydrogenase family protein molybdopterin-binding subunit [Polaribacter sp.]
GIKLPEGHGLGLAVHYSFYSYVATVVEVSSKDDKIKVENIWTAIEQSNFHDYPMTRMIDAPNIDITIIDNMETAPTGVGEPGVPVIAPAICNAIFNATGKRVRTLPLMDLGMV